MAKFHQGLKYHEDTVEKHPIDMEDLKFLQKLQKEMNTQDTCWEADPRYWGIMDKKQEYCGADEPDEYDICINSDGPITNDRELYNWLVREKFQDSLADETDVDPEIEMDGDTLTITCGDAQWRGITGFKDFIESDYDIEQAVSENWDIQFHGWNEVEYMCMNSMFLTQKRAEEHLRKRGYHYHEDAHTYAMTSEDPDMEALYKVIQSVDWAALEKLLERKK